MHRTASSSIMEIGIEDETTSGNNRTIRAIPLGDSHMSDLTPYLSAVREQLAKVICDVAPHLEQHCLGLAEQFRQRATGEKGMADGLTLSVEEKDE